MSECRGTRRTRRRAFVLGELLLHLRREVDVKGAEDDEGAVTFQ